MALAVRGAIGCGPVAGRVVSVAGWQVPDPDEAVGEVEAGGGLGRVEQRMSGGGSESTPTHFVWSRSYGRYADSELTVDPRDGAITRRLVSPNMSEDLATVGGEIYKVRTVHHGPLGELIP